MQLYIYLYYKKSKLQIIKTTYMKIMYKNSSILKILIQLNTFYIFL